MKLVLFDLDNTLLDGDSDYEWAQFLIDQGVLERASYEHRNQEFFDQYKAGRLDIYAFLDFQLAPLAQYPRAQLDAWQVQFMAQKILPKISAAARRQVSQRVREAPSSPPPIPSSRRRSRASSAWRTWSPPSPSRSTADLPEK